MWTPECRLPQQNVALLQDVQCCHLMVCKYQSAYFFLRSCCPSAAVPGCGYYWQQLMCSYTSCLVNRARVREFTVAVDCFSLIFQRQNHYFGHFRHMKGSLHQMSSNVLNLIQRTVSSMTESRKYDYQTCNSNIEIIHSIHIMVQMIRTICCCWLTALLSHCTICYWKTKYSLRLMRM